MEHIAVTEPVDGVARLTIDRSTKRNALSIQVREEMCDALDALRADQEVKVVVVGSVGPVFSAGFDLQEFADPGLAGAVAASSERWHTCLRTFPLPLIAAVQGPALAGGFDLATMCDLRVAATSASFARPERTWALPIYSILRDLVGGALARELTFTGRVLDAAQAHAVGLVTLVVDDDGLAPAAHELALDVARAPRAALLATKSTAIAAAKLATEAELSW